LRFKLISIYALVSTAFLMLFSACTSGQVTTTAVATNEITITQTQTIPPATVTQTLPPATITTTNTIIQTEIPPVTESIQIVQDLTPADAHALIMDNSDNPEFVIIDVRTPSEHAELYLEGSALIDLRSDTWLPTIKALDRNYTYLVI